MRQHHRQHVLMGVLALKSIQQEGTLGQVSSGILGLQLSSQHLPTFTQLLPQEQGSRLLLLFLLRLGPLPGF